MATHSSTLAWKIPLTEEPGRLQSMGSWRVGHNWATSLSLFTFTHWRRKWQPTLVFLPGESQGWGSLVGCRMPYVHRVGHDWSDLVVVWLYLCLEYWGERTCRDFSPPLFEKEVRRKLYEIMILPATRAGISWKNSYPLVVDWRRNPASLNTVLSKASQSSTSPGVLL